MYFNCPSRLWDHLGGGCNDIIVVTIRSQAWAWIGQDLKEALKYPIVVAIIMALVA